MEWSLAAFYRLILFRGSFFPTGVRHIVPPVSAARPTHEQNVLGQAARCFSSSANHGANCPVAIHTYHAVCFEDWIIYIYDCRLAARSAIAVFCIIDAKRCRAVRPRLGRVSFLPISQVIKIVSMRTIRCSQVYSTDMMLEPYL